MRYLLLSDIHGNWPALEAVLRAAPPFDRVLFLGDAVGYYPEGGRVLDFLMEVEAVPVLGNHDAWLLALEEEAPSGILALLSWQKARLSPRQLEYLWSWPWTQTLGEALLVHGSPCDPLTYVEDLATAQEALACTEARLVLHGHTHLAGAFLHLEAPRAWTRYQPFPQGGELLLPPKARALVNPGSVGQPRDRSPGAAFALWEGEKVAFFRVAYDLDRVREGLLRAGFPLWLWERLLLGQ